MLSKTATDVLSEGEYERVRMQLHHALRGDGNPPQGARVWQAGWHLLKTERTDARHDHRPAR